MKRVWFLLALLFSCSSNDDSNGDNNGLFDDIFFIRSQQDLDEFSSFGYEEFQGDLIIVENMGPTGLRDLKGLESLRSIDGDLSILGISEPFSLEGLENLTEITGSLFISDVFEQGGSLRGLRNLERIGDLLVVNFTGLNTISDLESLESLGSLQMRNNPFLTDLSGLERIRSLIELDVQGNESLTSFTGLENLETVERRLWIGNESIQSYSALSSLKSSPELDIEIVGSRVVKDLSGLEGITTIKKLTLFSLRDLESLRGLNNLESTELLFLANCDSLRSISSVRNLRRIGVLGADLTLIIDSNDKLESLDGLENVEEFLGSISIKDNDVLSDFCGIRGLLNNGDPDTIEIVSNSYNPTPEIIVTPGQCSN